MAPGTAGQLTNAVPFTNDPVTPLGGAGVAHGVLLPTITSTTFDGALVPNGFTARTWTRYWPFGTPAAVKPGSGLFVSIGGSAGCTTSS